MKDASCIFIPSESWLVMQKGIKFAVTMLVIFLSWAAISPVSGATYYVATNGNDSNPGTFELPWLTIHKAAQTMVAGDTTYIRGGQYNVTTGVTLPNSGSPGNYITFSAYQNELPVIDSGNREIRFFPLTSAHSYFRFVGLKFQNFKYTGAAIGIIRSSLDSVSPHHVEVINCTMVNNSTNSWIKAQGAHDLIFAGCTFSGGKQGIELAVQNLGNTYNIQIIDCKFSNMTWEGVVAKAQHDSGYDPLYWCENVYISGCESSYNGDDGFDLFGRYFTLEHCIAHHIASGIDLHGFKIYALDLPVEPGRYHADFYRCLTYGNNREGYKLTSLMIEESTDYIKKFRMINCTAAGDSYGISLVSNDIHPMDVTIKNSLISSTTRAWEITGTPVIWAPPPPQSEQLSVSSLPNYLTLDSDYNLWYAGGNSPINYLGVDYSLEGWQTESGQDINSISVNPNFDANFHPGNSACIDGGVDVGLPYAGDAPDMGYFESGTVNTSCPPDYLMAGENWVSIPVQAINDGPYSVFKDLGTWPNSVYHNLYRYESATSSLVAYPTYQSDSVQFGKIVPGIAYKLILGGNQTSLRVSGIELRGTQTLTIGSTGTRNFYFGNPFNKALYKSHCRIKNGTTEVSIDDAISSGWIGSVQHFNPTSKSWEAIGNILEKWHAYRLTAYTTGELQLIAYDLPDGDLDGDGDVDINDLSLMGDNWLDSNCINRPVGALDDDCDVDFKDYAILAGNWLEET